MNERLIVKEKIEETYKGIPYSLKLLSYSNHLNYIPSSMGVKGEWWVLENDNTPQEVKDLYRKIGKFTNDYFDDFLWEDSLHIYNDGKSLEERKQQMRKEAHRQIDLFYNSISRIDSKLDKLKQEANDLKKEFKKTELILNV